MFFFNLSLAEFTALFAAVSGAVFALYLLDRSRRKIKVATMRFWRPSDKPPEAKHRKRIQQRLAAQGYYTSGIDGAFGQGTYNAINAYANAQGKATQLNTPAGVHGVFGDLIY